MCNKGNKSLSGFEFSGECDQAVYMMDSPSTNTGSARNSSLNSSDEIPRVKFLCSFLGSIMPRPQDGKLRYVGGETRIVSVPRDITYVELMNRMRELYEEVSILKYQQPDEDLDALVSVINDDDVINMMEEYDKLGSVDGFIKLRVFMFSHADQDGLSLYGDLYDMDSEKRYLDALNDLHEYGSQQPESPLLSPGDDIYLLEQYLHQMSLQGSFHNQRNSDVSYNNLHHLPMAHTGSGQYIHSAQRYTDMEAPWSPGYYSPRHLGQHDSRMYVDFPTSPSSARYHVPFSECRAPEEYVRQHAYPQAMMEHQQQFSESVLRMPSGSVSSDKDAFPGNIICSPGMSEGNSHCEHCEMAAQRNQPYMEQANMSNGLPGVKRLNNCLTPNYSSMNLSQRHGNCMGSHPVPANLTHHRAGHEFGNEIFHDQAMSMLPQVRLRPPEECGARHVAGHPLWKQTQSPFYGASSYEASGLTPQANVYNPGFLKGNFEGSPRSHIGLESQNQCVRGMAVERTTSPEYSNVHPLKLSSSPSEILSIAACRETACQTDPSAASLRDKMVAAHVTEAENTEGKGMLAEEKDFKDIDKDGKSIEKIFSSPKEDSISDNVCDAISGKSISLNCLRTAGESGCTARSDLKESPKESELLANCLKLIPDLIASVKEKMLERAEEVKITIHDENDPTRHESVEQDIREANSGEDTKADTDNENPEISKIERTKAEAEAIAQGLQTIKNEDLEEIRQLGSGTYGAVYHGKWKGSGVAIKRIKASCFAGKPSERERLIADFWKEALILSSLHHPNVVSFYGIVRDGPDGSLATVTEFMVNGSLKQFLQKKDRTIDRRKRLIIAMDTAFGMEYLHEKNIVHFDLKCENLLVNMRDPQRPVCKIGDLGLSKVKQQTLVSGGVRGTLPWMAPELLTGKSDMVTEKIDVYSFGIVMWELLTGEEPYADMRGASIIGGIVNNTLRPQIPTWCDPEWKALMESCWASDPGQRPSFSEISQKLRGMAAAMNLK